jgi:hypothetical protein
MVDAAQIPDPQAVAARAIAQLTELADIGLSLARSLQNHAAAAELVQAENAKVDPYCFVLPPADYATLANAYTRISRAIRMTLALQARLLNPRCRQRQSAPPSDVVREDRPRPEAPRENLFDTPDPERWLDQPAVDSVCLCADAPAPALCSPLGELSDPSPTGLTEGAAAPRSTQPASGVGTAEPNDHRQPP